MVPNNRTKTKKLLVWRALWRRLLEPGLKNIWWFFCQFFPNFCHKNHVYGLDLDSDLLWLKKDWIQIRFQQNAWSGLRLSESRLKSLTMTKGILYLYWVRFLARGFLVENISLGKFKYTNVNFVYSLEILVI
jgi:hypothetical protein